MIDKPGRYENVSFADYLADPCPEPALSRSTIIDLLDNPARARANHPKLAQEGCTIEDANDPDDKKFDIGKASHSLLLEGIDLAVKIDPVDFKGPKGGIPKGWTTDLIREARDEAIASGKIPLLPKQYEKVLCMVEEAKKKIAKCADFTVKDLRCEGDSEVTYIWQEENGVWCKVRLDWISKDRSLIIDFKTTGVTANPSYISSHFSKMGYAIQDRFYCRGVSAVDGVTPKFVFLFQEDEYPYLCSWIGSDPQNQAMAEEKIDTAIKLWSKCLKDGAWEEYPDKICYPEARPFELASWEEKKSHIGESIGNINQTANEQLDAIGL